MKIEILARDNNFAEILERQGISLAVSCWSNQASLTAVLYIYAKDGSIKSHISTLGRPMSVAVDDTSLVVATQNSLVYYADNPQLAEKASVGRFYTPQAVKITGFLDVHQVSIIDGDTLVAATMFNSIGQVHRQLDYSFTPEWYPHRLKQFSPNDINHVNGFSVVNESYRHISMFSQDIPWRDAPIDSGAIVHAYTQAPYQTGLVMPHSPLWYVDDLYFLEAGNGLLWSLKGGKIFQSNSFLRGLDASNGVAFVGRSKARHMTDGTIYNGIIPVLQKNLADAGVSAIDLNTGNEIGSITFSHPVSEIFSVTVIPTSSVLVAGMNDQIVNFSYNLPFDPIA